MADKLNLSTQSNDVITNIASFLTHHDVINLTFTSKNFHFLSTDNLIWKHQTINLVPVKLIVFNEDFVSLNEKEQFVSIINKYIQFRTMLANIINKAVPNFKAHEFLRDNFFSNIKAKKDIENIVSTEYERIPLEYYILYRLLNGQDVLKDKLSKDFGLLGAFTYYNFYFENCLLPLSKPENIQILAKYKFCTLAICRISGARLFADFHNVLKKGHGAVFLIREQRNEYGKKIIRAFVCNQSLTDLLTDLQTKDYNSEDDFLDLFDSLNNPSSDVTTNGIRVRTSIVFSPFDRRDGYLFAYQIRVSPNGVQGHWKLTQRHWIINDNGEPHEVKGPGVIGLYPEVYEGCPEFTYQSCTPMHGFNGTMGGFLYFRNNASGEEIAVKVGDMRMKMPEGTSWVDFCPENGEVKEAIDL